MNRLHLKLLTLTVKGLRKAFDKNPGRDSNLELGIDVVLEVIENLVGLHDDIRAEAMYRRSRLESITERHSKVLK